ncbi:unnamed protein product [Durusdinium trenchii]|uniref:ABC transmembrane type-1 domain-containing protein n=1 Tax=Durusdinium trenchii TaxID=1381693 RepID=A0ABP0LJS7_9DINO
MLESLQSSELIWTLEFWLWGPLEHLDLLTDAAMPWQAAACNPAATDRFVAVFGSSGVLEDFPALADWLGLSGLMALMLLFAVAAQQWYFSWLDFAARAADGEAGAAVAAAVAGLQGVAEHFEGRWTVARQRLGRIQTWREQDWPLRRQAKTMVALIKVAAQNLPQLFLQSAFLSLAFTELGSWGRWKVLLSMGLGVVNAVHKLCQMTSEMILLMWRRREERHWLNLALLVLLMEGFALVAQAVNRIVMAHLCPSHQWNLATGCVHQ